LSDETLSFLFRLHPIRIPGTAALVSLTFRVGVTVSANRHEFSLIEWIRAQAPDHPRLTIGIGDDTASLRFPNPSDCLVTSDMLIEGVHFTLPPATPRDIGRKALAVNLSDIAAMAGNPLAAVISVALSRERDMEFARELHHAMLKLADEFGVSLAGGDTNIWDGPLVVSVTLLGETTEKGPVRRSGARVGDWIMTTGFFGGSFSGKHVSFQPRVTEALQLHDMVSLHAMIDVSDGLAADLHHILDESKVGAVLYEEAIPIADASQRINDDQSSLEHALGDGEDFELLFCVSPEDGRLLLADSPVDIRLSHIGEIIEAGFRELADAAGNRKPLPCAGWVHQF
jgi:thiamine-monophosphate kinase